MYTIIDTTLREGEQTPGIHFSLSEKKNIIDGLVDLGITEVEIGISSPLISCPTHLLSYCRSNHPALLCSVWSRCVEKDIHHAAKIKPDILSLSIPVSDILIREKLGKDRTWVMEQMKSSITFAGELGLAVSIGFEDATRADSIFLHELAREAEQAGAMRIRLADTIGTAMPEEIGRLIRRTREAIQSDILAIHTHNDLGLATANAIAALNNGANSADATLLGLGERCGCARIEELCGILHIRYNQPFRLRKLQPLCNYLSAITKREVAANQPFTGRDIFTCETGLHLQALQKNGETYEPYPPEKIGTKRNLIIGRKSGRKAILQHLKSKGFSINSRIGDADIEKVRKMLATKNLTDEELFTYLTQ